MTNIDQDAEGSQEPIRLLYVTADKFPTFRVDVSVLFAQELVKRGFAIDWIFASEANPGPAYETQYAGGRAYIAATDTRGTRLGRVRKHLLALANDLRMMRLVRGGRYDFLVVRNEFLGALIALLAVRRTRTRLVYWLSFPYPEASVYEAQTGTARYPLFYYLRGWFFAFLLYRVILPRVTHAFVQSEQMKKDIAKEGIPPDSLTPVPMGVQLSAVPYEEPRAAGDKESLAPRVVYLGTLNRMRKLDFLVRAFSKVVDRYPDARLVFVGRGDDPLDEEFLRQEADAVGVSGSVEFLGFIPMKDAWDHVRRARVCVSPIFPTPIFNSVSPTKLIEYLAMGRPVVGNDQPEQRLVLEESGAGYCVPWEETRFAEAICALLGDPEGADAMGRKGRTYVATRRDYGIIADHVAATFRSIKGGPEA